MSHLSLRHLLDERSTSTPPLVPATADVSSAIALMSESDIDAVVAVAGGRVAGVFTLRDALKHALSASDAGTGRIADAMSSDVPVVYVGASVADALALSNERGCDYVVVHDDGEALGVVSKADLARSVIREQQAELDCAIRAVKWMGYTNRRP